MITFGWKWRLEDLLPPDKDVTVFSTFSCGGGSTMGYKRAGFRVLGNVELDKPINAMYVKNHHPKYNYCMDLRDFNTLYNLPDELYRLDILDGSPPCSVFSTAGERDKNWGKEKKFREGQKEQRLDDLFFVFLDTARKLKPRVVIAENVTGLIKGKARWYVREIINGFHDAGYEVQLFKLNAMYMDVPQQRERVFFIANNQGFNKLTLSFDRPLIPFGQIRTERGKPLSEKSVKTRTWLKYYRPSDVSMGNIKHRLLGTDSRNCASNRICADARIVNTITSGGTYIRAYDFDKFSDEDYINTQTFPQDYDFCGNNVQYVCGMSVPPNMMAHIATQVYEQWFKGGE